MMEPNTSHLRLLLTGLATGDSLGSTSEFAGPEGVAAAYAKHSPAGWPFRQVGGGPFNWHPGDPTDDTDMAMCIVRAVVESDGRFDADVVAEKFGQWYESGPRDIGGTTARALRRRQTGTHWFNAGYDGYQVNSSNSANGSLMRNGVVAALSGDMDDVFCFTLQQAIITHYDPLSVLCCGVQSYLLRRLLNAGPGDRGTCLGNGGPADWVSAGVKANLEWLTREPDGFVSTWRERVGEAAIAKSASVLAAADFSPAFNPFDARWRAVGQGYSVLTLQIALWALMWAARNEPYPDLPSHLPVGPFQHVGAHVLGWVALIGRDSDTYGATAGPLLAAACGGLPTDLSAGLKVLAEVGKMLPPEKGVRASAGGKARDDEPIKTSDESSSEM